MGNTLKKYILVTEKKWHDSLFESLEKSIDSKWTRIADKSEFTHQNLLRLQPDKIFIPHWSNIIPSDIYLNWDCIVFHMTDLPYGRGGSPLQNLIERGHTETVISAIKVEQGIDTGDVYLKYPLSLAGTAEDIFIRASGIIEKMIEEIIHTSPVPKKQEGEAVVFKRRKSDQSNIENLETIHQVYDFIRMLDCEGYPNAYIETKFFKLEFNKATINNNSIDAYVRITKK
jgi:methionyl-tRNA formyltransferase